MPVVKSILLLRGVGMFVLTTMKPASPKMLESSHGVSMTSTQLSPKDLPVQQTCYCASRIMIRRSVVTSEIRTRVDGVGDDDVHSRVGPTSIAHELSVALKVG